jgi:hypothetical protein
MTKIAKKTTATAPVVETPSVNVNTIKVQRAKARWAPIGRKKPLASQDVLLCTRAEWDRIVAVREPLKRWSALSFPGDMVVAISPMELADVSPAEVKRFLTSF